MVLALLGVVVLLCMDLWIWCFGEFLLGGFGFWFDVLFFCFGLLWLTLLFDLWYLFYCLLRHCGVLVILCEFVGTCAWMVLLLDSKFGLRYVDLVGFVAQGGVTWIEWLCFLVGSWWLMLLSFSCECFFGFDDSVSVFIA